MEILGGKKIKSKMEYNGNGFVFWVSDGPFPSKPQMHFLIFLLCMCVGGNGRKQSNNGVFFCVSSLSEASFINSNKPQEAKGKVGDRTKGWVQATWVMWEKAKDSVTEPLFSHLFKEENQSVNSYSGCVEKLSSFM